MNPGITLTHQMPASAITTIAIDDRSPTDIWRELARSTAFQAAIEDAIRVNATGKSPNEFRDELSELDLPLGFDELAVRVAKGDPNSAYRLAYVIETLGSGWTSLEDIRDTLSLLRGGRTPVVGLRLTSSFFDRRAEHRRVICELIADLACACDVRLVGSGISHRRLARTHREELPGISEQCSTSHPELSPEAVVETARGELDHGSREVSILRDLRDEPSETLSLHAIRAGSRVSRSRISQCVSRLRELDVIATFETSEGKYIELIEGGRGYLNVLDREIGRQRRLDECVSDTGKCSKYSRVSTDKHDRPRPGHADRRQLGQVVDPAYLPRWRQVAASGAATEGSVTFVDHPEEETDEVRQPYLGYDEAGHRLVVGAEYVNPMQWWVCVARALTDPRIFRDVLTPDRLDGEVGNLGELVTDDTRILRDARCLGWLRDADANADDYAEALMNAEDSLLDLLRRWHNDDYECSATEFRRLITRHALGMAGTIAHLCDLADVELIRELRLLEFSRRFSDADRRADLSKTIVTGAQIASRHGHFAAYRQLFEPREDKRAAAMQPTIPAHNPTGELIGSFVMVGDSVSSFADELRDTFENGSPHENAPEFDVRVDFETEQGRSAFAHVVRAALASKNLSATRMAISLFHGIAGSVYDVADAITHNLSTEDLPRDVRLDEVRVALAGLPQQRLLPEMKPSIRQITKALLVTESPLTKSELAGRAETSTRSVRDRLPQLEALGLVEISETGIRFTLPFAISEERGRDIVPGLAGSVLTGPVDVLYELAQAIIGDAAHDPAAAIGAAFFAEETIDILRDLPVIGRWVSLAERLSDRGTEPAPSEVRFGPTVEQAALQEVVA